MTTKPLLANFVPRLLDAAQLAEVRIVKGRIQRVIGNTIYAVLAGVRLGEICELQDAGSGKTSRAEVVGLDDTIAILSPLTEMHGISTATEVIPTGRFLEVPVGKALLGRVLDGFGAPLDEFQKGPLPSLPVRPLHRAAPPALLRKMIHRPMSVGVRSIDGVLTVGEGQRLGVYGPPGVGKSQLLAQILKMSTADVRVIALVGERGREVREFIERHLTEDTRASSVVVVSTSDRSSVERIKAAHTAMAIAEYFRDEGARVLLVVDNITRLARALREVGLSAGEPPTRRGFPPSVFTALPALFERAGLGEKGSITALFSVLVEGESSMDPVAEETRGLLDGHFILAPKLAQSGHFPAIDIAASLSRVMTDIVSPEHNLAARRLRQLIAKYSEVEFLIQVGEYKPGSDALADEAIAKKPVIEQFLRQSQTEHCSYEDALHQLRSIVA